MNYKKIWRPKLFSALGAGFKEDATVRDGIHLRWNFDPKLGLPYRLKKHQKGNFRVFYMNQEVKSIKNLDLFQADRGLYNTYSANIFNLHMNGNSTLLPADDKFYFIKKTNPSQVALDWHVKNITKYVKTIGFTHSQEEKSFRTYFEEVMNAYRPTYVPTKPEWEISEICAVDIDFSDNPKEFFNTSSSSHRLVRNSSKKFSVKQFQKMNALTAEKLTNQISKFSNLSKHEDIKKVVNNFKVTPIKKVNTVQTKNINTNFSEVTNANNVTNITALAHLSNLEIIDRLSELKDAVYVRVKAWNRDDQLVDEDWIGVYGQPLFVLPNSNKTNAKRKMKTRVSLRAPGIEYLTFEFLQETATFFPTAFKYIFCEDYCRNEKIWSTKEWDYQTVFNATGREQTAHLIKNQYYAPFKKRYDWTTLSKQIKAHFTEYPDIQKLINQKNTYDTFSYQMEYEAQDVTPDNTDMMRFPLLSTLLSGSVDPSFANILGLYMFIEELEHDGRDFKIEADFPFFEKENVEIMDHKLGELLTSSSNTSILQQLASLLTDTQLCGLVMGPKITKKPAPPTPSPLHTTIDTVDLPNQKNPKKYDLFGNAKITIPFDTNEIRPYQRMVAVALDRSRNSGPFLNIIESEETTFNPLEGFSILPGVYMPKKENGVAKDAMEIKDYFSIPATDTITIQYQGTSYDIFGRPSEKVIGASHTLTLPCKEPQQPANLSAQIRSEGDTLRYEVVFSIYSGIVPLVASKEMLEMYIHELPESLAPPEQVTWGGTLPAKIIEIPYNTGKTALTITAMNSGCQELSWSGDVLQRNTTAASICNLSFSNDLPKLEEIADVPSFSLTDTGYRTYKLSWNIQDKSRLVPGNHQWACRIRIKGECPRSNKKVYSKEVVINASIRITPPPPAVLQPIQKIIPESTFADHKGDSYYAVDLHDFIPVGDRVSRPLVRIYAITLDKITENVHTLIEGTTLLDQTLFLQQAKASKLPFKLLTDPVRYHKEDRFIQIKVPGDLEAFHVVGVIGCNAYLEEMSWKNAGIFLFKTPSPVDIPKLQKVLTEPFIAMNSINVGLQFSIQFNEPISNTAFAPKIQLLRKSKTLNERYSTFLKTVTGIVTNENDSSTYTFDFIDEDVQALHRYEYEAYSLVYSKKRGHYVKSNEFVIASVMTPVVDNTGISPTERIDPPMITKTASHIQLDFEFDIGEYDFSLTKKSNDGSRARHTGKIRNGSIQSKTIEAFLKKNSRYAVTFKDTDLSEGVYTLRLSYGQAFTWTKKIAITS